MVRVTWWSYIVSPHGKGNMVVYRASNRITCRMSLCDKLDGKSPEDRKMGPSTVLTKAEEAMLAAFCIRFLKCGFPINRQYCCQGRQGR